MKTKINNLKVLLVAILCILGLIFFLTGIPLFNALCYENTNQHIRQDYDDIPADYEGFVECEEASSQIQSLNASISNHGTCNSITSSHGTGRQNGYNSNFLFTGCGNYMSNGYEHGTSDVSYFIHTAGFSTALINDIEAQAALWNEAVMHDGTGQIVNVNRVYQTVNLNGHHVCEVSYDSDTSVVGLFTHPIWLFAPTPKITIGAGANSDTPIHEFGHLLGLGDLDKGHNSGTHQVLMGYSRGNRSGQLQYQDIQGIAVMNNRHTTHRYDRYVKSGNNYFHFCFYCDTVDSRTSVISGSSVMTEASSCVHTYQPMVSAGNRHWHKCTKCYKVIESEFNVQGLTNTTLEVRGLFNTNKASITIPAFIGGQAIIAIGSSAFANQTSVTEILLPYSITSIGDSAFSGCTNLNSIGIPYNVTNVDSNVFLNCNQLTIYAEAASKPSGWNANWNSSNRPVNWNKCSICVAEITQTVTGTGHTLVCTNGHPIVSGLHNFNYINQSGNHIKKCTVCSYEVTETHSYNHHYGIYTNNQHYAYCACRASALASHNIIQTWWSGSSQYGTCGQCNDTITYSFILLRLLF